MFLYLSSNSACSPQYLACLILYIIISIIVVYVLIVGYLKCKSPFWAKQPVFHLYDLSYWLRPPGIISLDMPVINKYVDLIHVNTFAVDDELKGNELKVCKFLKDNYIVKRESAKYAPTQNNILSYLTASNHAAYISLYQEPLITLSDATNTDDSIIAVVTARPLYIRLNKKKIMFSLYYVDNLCVHPGYRKKNIASTMIQTHYYNLRRQNPRIQTCLFKREGTLNAIVPLVVFNTYAISIKEIIGAGTGASTGAGTGASTGTGAGAGAITGTGAGAGTGTGTGAGAMPPSVKLIEIGATQLSLFVDFIKTRTKTFACVILPDVTNLMQLLKTDNIKIYALVDTLVDAGTIVACYVFRMTEYIYEGQKTAECIMMLSADTIMDLFSTGFALSCSKLALISIELILIEDTAHAHFITDKLASKCVFVSPTAFFLYNYACYSIKKSEFLIIY